MMITNLPVEWLTLADAVLKATVILAGAAAASFALRRASAAFRHLLWTLALCGALAVPALTIMLPKWQLPIVRIAATPMPVVHATADAQAPAAPALPSQRRAHQTATPSATVPSIATPLALSETPAEARPSTPAITWQQALLAIWLAGTAIVLARLALGFAAIRWLSRRTRLITDASWLPMAEELATEMGLQTPPRFLQSSRASMPIAAGIFRPAIIMPADANTWTETRMRIVLLHELAHVKRRDCLTHLVAQAACAFYWFNPLAWLAAKRARAERERACDDLVIAAGTRGSDYADELLEMARAMRGDRFGLLAGASLAMAHRSQLEGRLIAILDPKVRRAGVSRASTTAAVALCISAVAPLGALQPWAAHVDQNGTRVDTVLPGEASAPAPAEEPIPVESDRRELAEQQLRQPQSWQLPQLPQRPQAAQYPQLPPVIDEVLAPVMESAIAAVTTSIDEKAIADTVADALATENQEPKPKPEPKPAKGGGGREVDPRMVAALTAALKDTDKEVRETAMHALVQLRDPSIYEPLVQALKDASPDVREQAVFGLGQLRDRRAVEPLTTALKDENADVRENAAFALGQLRDRSAVPALIQALKDPAADVREQAAFALSQLRDPSAVEALGAATRDENADVREQAVFALSQIRDSRSVAPLISVLKDANPDVREQAAFALGQLRDRSAVDALVIAIKDADADVREQVAFALGQIRDPRAIEALTIALKDQNADVRQQAAFALGQLAR
jgi:HEAT repeat protein/beta-lactamase regulating signal transducer with metallopeptidase domain